MRQTTQTPVREKVENDQMVIDHVHLMHPLERENWQPRVLSLIIQFIHLYRWITAEWFT